MGAGFLTAAQRDAARARGAGGLGWSSALQSSFRCTPPEPFLYPRRKRPRLRPGAPSVVGRARRPPGHRETRGGHNHARSPACQRERVPNLNYQTREWLWIPGAPVICGRFFRSPPVRHSRRYLSSHPGTCGVLVLHNSVPCQLQVSTGCELGVLGVGLQLGMGEWREELPCEC